MKVNLDPDMVQAILNSTDPDLRLLQQDIREFKDVIDERIKAIEDIIVKRLDSPGSRQTYAAAAAARTLLDHWTPQMHDGAQLFELLKDVLAVANHLHDFKHEVGRM